MVIFHSCVSLPEGNGGFKLINQRYSGAATPGPARLSLAQRRLSSWGSQAAPYFRLEAPSGLVAAEAKFENPPPSLICCWNIWGVAIQKMTDWADSLRKQMLEVQETCFFAALRTLEVANLSGGQDERGSTIWGLLPMTDPWCWYILCQHDWGIWMGSMLPLKDRSTAPWIRHGL